MNTPTQQELGLYANYKTLLIERSGSILRVSLNNPPVNSMTLEMHQELSTIFLDVNRDPQVRVVVLTGEGKAFCAGGNILEMKERLGDVAWHMHFFSVGANIIHGLLSLDKPVICRLNGHAMGLGATIALLCDIVVATDSAKIGDPHVRMGLSAGDGGAMIWPARIGLAKAKELLLLGDSVTAQEGVQLGLINYAVPAHELDFKVNAMAERLNKGAALAIRNTKRSINLLLRERALVGADAHFKLEIETAFSTEHAEAVDAFLQKREPDFIGSSALSPTLDKH